MTEIAEEVGFSVFSFIRHFARAFGLSPCAWRTQARANEAAKLLREGKQAAEAAALSGFSDQSHMARYVQKGLRDYTWTILHDAYEHTARWHAWPALQLMTEHRAPLSYVPTL